MKIVEGKYHTSYEDWDTVLQQRRQTMANENETEADIAAEIRSLADRIEAACKSEAQAMERIVRDAIISYSELFSNVPGDDAERELKERAARANAWLASHGFAEEKAVWSKEESPCL